MRALVYHGPGSKRWEERPDPVVRDATDAIVGVDTTTICGTDLHILKGDVPEVTDGRILGHEAVGTIEAVGDAVTTVQPGDRVLVSCISSCGRCRFCREGRYGLCVGGGGWVLGHTIDGTQAEYVRIPFADTSLHRLPPAVEAEDAVLLSDIFPTAYEVGVLNGAVRPADLVVIVGAGPIGLAAAVTARFFTPRHLVVVDVADARLDLAKQFGVDETINSAREDAVERVRAMSAGLGADVVMEAVGLPETLELCTRLVRPGGRVANIGVHGRPASLALESLWAADITITTGLVDTVSTPTLLQMLSGGLLRPTGFATHHFALHYIEAAYDTFEHAAEQQALKVVLQR